MKRLFLATGILLLVIGAGALGWASRSTPYVRDRIVEALNEHFASRVDVRVLHVDAFPRPQISGSGLSLHYRDDTDAPPLIQIGRFSASAGVYGLFAHPLHLRDVMVEGLDIRIPVGGVDIGTGAANGRVAAKLAPIVIDEITSTHARLEIPSHRRDRLPRVFDIENLFIEGYGHPQGATFRASLTNPIPRGRIDTSGTFGPWNTDDPERTAVRGRYTFKHANLDDIKGIGGTLSSIGTYDGVLNRLVVEGQTDTPDFRIDVANAPVPLSTRFKAVVDGTNGDTRLERVDAQLAESAIVARGEVVRAQDVKGRRVTLDVSMNGARLEDLMRLAVNTREPPIRGRVDLATTFNLPAGNGTVADRLQLDGRFTLAQARFTSLNVQRRITLLSQRGRGDDDGDGTEESVVSNLRGRFTLRDARLTFADLTFAVPGAQVVLAGTYDLHSQAINFAGDLLTDASLADMTHGFRSILAHLAQPFFRRPGGGTRMPIRISGTRSNPSFHVDVKRVFKRN